MPDRRFARCAFGPAAVLIPTAPIGGLPGQAPTLRHARPDAVASAVTALLAP